MLLSRAPGAFVCLRCKIRLARPRLSTLTHRTSHAKFSASTRCRNGAAELEALSQAQQPGLKITREGQTLGRYRRRKGKVIHETSARLGGLKSLGDDASILVLREVGDSTPAEHTTKPEEVELLEVPDILASLQEDRKLTPEEIHTQIESLRPKINAGPNEPHYVTQKTFVKLRRVLTNRFTQEQLLAFYSVAKDIRQKKVTKVVIKGLKRKNGAAVERSGWQPGTTAIDKRVPGLHVKHFKSVHKTVSKQLLIDRILREVWTLVLLEEIEAPGELELTLKDWHIELLNAGEDETKLDKIGQTRRVKFEIFKKDNVLRITADQNTAEYAANDVEEALQNAQARQLRLKFWRPLLLEEKMSKGKKSIPLYSQNDLDMVAKLTRTAIHKDSDNMFLIKGFDKSAVEEAERSLIGLLPLRNLSARTIDTQKVDAANNSRYLLPVVQEERSLEHKFRNLKLGRWVLPIARAAKAQVAEDQGEQEEPVQEPSEQGNFSHDLVNRTVATIQHLANPMSKPAEEVGSWAPDAEYNLSAAIGQVLFPCDHANFDKAIRAALSQSSQSPFVASFPGLSGLLTSADFSDTARTQAPSLLYEFTAAPKQAKQHPPFPAGQLFPSLRIQMRTSGNGGKATLHKLSLGVQQHVHDVLLPDKAADVRFNRYVRLEFKYSHCDGAVQDWTDAVVANIQSGGRLSAPSLRIDVPRWTIPGQKGDVKGTCTVTYLLSGIHFRQSITGQFLGTTVSYSTVQSGKLGAKGGMLNAYYNTNKDGDPLLQDEDELKAFVRTCFGIVDKVTEASARTLPVSKMLNPRNQNSARKLRRLGQQVTALDVADPSTAAEVHGSDAESWTLQEQDLYQTQGELSGDETQTSQASSVEARDEHSGQSSSAAVQHTAAEDTEDPYLSSALALTEPAPSLTAPLSADEPNRVLTSNREEDQTLKSTA